MDKGREGERKEGREGGRKPEEGEIKNSLVILGDYQSPGLP